MAMVNICMGRQGFPVNLDSDPQGRYHSFESLQGGVARHLYKGVTDLPEVAVHGNIFSTDILCETDKNDFMSGVQ